MAKEDYIDLDQEENIDEDRGDFFEEDEELEDEDLEEEIVEDDEEEDLEEEEEEEVPVKEPKIPKSRLDEVIAQREDARERNLWLEAQLEKLISQSQQQIQAKEKAPEPTYDFAAAEEKYASLLIEGEIGPAAKLRTEINAQYQKQTERLIKEIKESSTAESIKASSAAIDQERFDNLVENYENKYKFLDSNSKDYNEEAVDTVNTLLAGYVAAGKSKAEGLRLAVQKVAPLYEKEVVKETKQSLGNKRKVEAGKKAAKASVSQPIKTKSTSARTSDSEVVNVAKMSERDFAKLTDREKRILRGD